MSKQIRVSDEAGKAIERIIHKQSFLRGKDLVTADIVDDMVNLYEAVESVELNGPLEAGAVGVRQTKRKVEHAEA